MKTFKFFIAVAVLLGVLSCSKISEKVEQKVNEKIDKTIDENLKKIDSTLNKSDIDSLKKLMKGLDTLYKDKENGKSDKK
jgi:hypothetical protein